MEVLSLALAGFNVTAAILAASSDSYVSYLKLPLLVSFGFYFIVALIVASQLTPLANRLHPNRSSDGDFDGIQLKDLKRLLLWAPLPHKVVGFIGLFVFCATLIAIGGVTWSNSAPFEQHHAVGIGLYVAALYAVASPILAAFARLPSSADAQAKAIMANDA
jgi:hypothetical protein